MNRKTVIVASSLLTVVAVLAGVKTFQIRALIAAGSQFTVPAETVSAAEARLETWESLLPAVGSVTAVQGVELCAELAGTVREIAFESGATAAAGQVLMRLDTSSEEAQLRSAEAQTELARLNLQRSRDLPTQGVISQADLDSREAAFAQSNAAAGAVRADVPKETDRPENTQTPTSQEHALLGSF